MKLETSIHIQANKKEVWNILMDFENYAQWNPFIKSIRGTANIGMALEIELPTMKFKPIVHTYKTEEFFSWKGKLFIRGIFDGHHQFELKELDEHNCLFIHKEEFSGILIPLLKKQLNTSTLLGFIAMNKSLKEKAENSINNHNIL
ncbi:SRPBCC domain-containing protein [Myroides sp. M-43]|uniref:SRPBCC domain-containing protein n=1 Tax=Myroides oncorhynchi TaxID=2893756 RepID=UPI001E6437CC|nr:SRPBCC domain-containing protein [Myroides oncorhynchi]MCC9042979.1 SRPBCC domain-containing protein [Myroides oncorhynchi]